MGVTFMLGKFLTDAGSRSIRYYPHVVDFSYGALLQRFTSQSIGTRLFEDLEAWARLHRLTCLELTVMAHNERAIALYKKRGFEVEGRRRNAILVDRQYVDKLMMAKLLAEEI